MSETSSSTEKKPKPRPNPAAEAILSQTKELPTAPPVVFKLMTLLKKPTQHNDEVVEIIRYDEHLTAKLLKLCNTAFFKASQPVTSLDQAVLRLGYANIVSIAVSLRIGDVVSKSRNAAFVNPYDLWRNSVTTAIAAKDLTPKCKAADINEDTAFTSGLLAEMGMVVFNACGKEEVSQIKPLAEEKEISLIEAEKELLGTTHPEVGALLLERWKLPPDIVEAVKYHLTPDEVEIPLADICHLANLCARIACGHVPVEAFTELVYPMVFERLGLTPEDTESTLQKLQDESGQVETFMMVA